MNKELNKLTAGVCAVLIASAALPAPSHAQAQPRRGDCPFSMEASPMINTGLNGIHIYTCSFEQDLVCFEGQPCASTVQRCRYGWQPTRWNTATMTSPDINTPPLTIYKDYQCWGTP